MRIGITYDLREDYLRAGFSEDETAEFDREETISALAETLETLGHDADRIGHARRLTERLVSGDRWDLVFNIAEGLHGIGREAQVPALLDLFGIPYTFSDPLVMSLTLHKAMTKRVLRDAGLRTAEFCVVDFPGEVPRPPFPPPFFIKPIAEGTGKGVSTESIVRDPADLPAACRRLWKAFHQPVLVEAMLPGREFTTGLTGTGAQAEVIGTMEVLLLAGADPGVYSYRNKELSEERVDYRLVPPGEDPVVEEIEAMALAAWRVLGCRDAGRIDFRCDLGGKPHFLEINPLAGLHPTHSDLPILCNLKGIPFRRLIERILVSAVQRLGGSD